MSNVKVITIEEEIDQSLVKENITEKVIASLKERYLPLKLKDLEDKEGYIEIVEARKDVKRIRVLATKVCKAGREKANQIRDKWISKEKEVVSALETIENHLSKQEDEFDAHKSKKAEEKRRQQDAQLFTRSQQLTGMGALFSDGRFILEDVSVDSSLVREADEETYGEAILSLFTPIFERNEKVRIEKEQAEKEAEAQRQKEREELQKQQDEFKRQQDELRLQQEKIENDKREREEADRVAKIHADENRWRGRLGQLKEIGWNGQYAFSRTTGNEDLPVFTYQELIDLSDEDFYIRKNEYNVMVDRILLDREETRLLKLEEEKQQAIQKALDDQKRQQEAEKLKAEEDERQRKIAEQEQLEQASDKEKWSHLLSQFSAIQLPIVASPRYRKKVAVVKEFLDNLKNI